MATSVLSSPNAAGTATSTLLQEMFVLEHPETTVQQNKTRKEKKRGEKEGIRGEILKYHSVGKEKTKSND